MKTKLCKIENGGCGQELELNSNNFYCVNAQKGWFQTLCKKCQNKKSCLWSSNNKKTVCNRVKQQYRNNPMQKNWAKDSIHGHKRSGYTVNISFKELYEKAINTKTCFYCDKELDWSHNKKIMNKNSPTLENTDLNQILTLNNTHIICLECNASKNNKSFNEFVGFCSKVSSKFKDS